MDICKKEDWTGAKYGTRIVWEKYLYLGLAVRVHVGWTTSTRGTAEPLVLQSAFRPRFITQWLCVGHRVFTNSFC